MKMKTTDQIVEHRLAIRTVYNMLENHNFERDHHVAFWALHFGRDGDV